MKAIFLSFLLLISTKKLILSCLILVLHTMPSIYFQRIQIIQFKQTTVFWFTTQHQSIPGVSKTMQEQKYSIQFKEVQPKIVVSKALSLSYDLTNINTSEKLKYTDLNGYRFYILMSDLDGIQNCRQFLILHLPVKISLCFPYSSVGCFSSSLSVSKVWLIHTWI